MSAASIPLQNLFLYIRDLYDVSEVTYEFTQEHGNRKTEDFNYWTLRKLLDLDKLCKQKGIKEFGLYLNDSLDEDDSDETLLKIKPVTKIPDEPLPPEFIRPWVMYKRHPGVIPSLILKQDDDPYEYFDDSSERVEAFNRLSAECANKYLYDLSGIPYILDNWVVIQDGKLQKIDQRKITVTLNSTERLKQLFTAYNKDFEAYFDKYWTAFLVNELYHALHGLYYDLKGKENKQLCLSFGMISGRIGGVEYRNYTFAVPLIMKLKNRAFEIHFDSISSKIDCECNFLTLLDKHFSLDSSEGKQQKKQSVLDMVEGFNSGKHAFVFDAEFIESEYMELARNLVQIFPNHKVVSHQEAIPFRNNDRLGQSNGPLTELQLNYDFYPDPVADRILLSFSPIIQTRMVETYTIVSRDAARIVRNIDLLEKNNQSQKIPPLFKKMFSIKRGEARADSPIVPPVKTLLDEGDFLFPLPYNKEQFDIVKRMQTDDAVIVKGPPGTGKSHTIANIISHYVSQGKSILVVSQNAKALNVVRDKLPESIRSLAVSLLGQGKSNEMLKNSVNSIIRHLSATYSEEYLQKLVQELSGQKQKYDTGKQDLIHRIRENQKIWRLSGIPVVIQGSARGNAPEEIIKTTAELAELYCDYLTFQNPVVDEISYHESHHDWVIQIENLLHYKGYLDPEEYTLFSLDCPPESEILHPDQRSILIEKLSAIKATIDPVNFSKLTFHDFGEDFFACLYKLSELQDDVYDDPMCLSVLRSEKFEESTLVKVYERYAESRAKIKQTGIDLINYMIETPSSETSDPKAMLLSLEQLIAKHGKSKDLGTLARALLPKEQKDIYNYKINFTRVSNVDDLAVLRDFYKVKCDTRSAVIAFSNYLKLLGLERQLSELDELKPLDKLYQYIKLVERQNRTLADYGMKTISLSSVKDTEYIKHLMSFQAYKEYLEILKKLEEYGKTYLSWENTHNSLRGMAKSVSDVESYEYNLQYEDFLQFSQVYPKLLVYRKAYQALYDALPQTAAYIHAQYVQGGQSIKPSETELAMFLARLRTILLESSGKIGDIEEAITTLHKLRKEIMAKTAELVAYNAWYLKSQKTTDDQKSALNAWLNDLTNIGRGYGKNTARNLASAIKNMDKAKDAVPIWIMTIANAITFFQDASPSQFDLMIIDEASQCDFSAFNLAFRSAKMIIVGDENQTAVAIDNTKFPKDKVNRLVDQYLPEHEHQVQFNVTNKANSIYSICSVLYPNTITLVEHFRCLPEIIGFSNKWVYNSDIIPLRTCAEYPYGLPVEARYVIDNPKDESRINLVEETVKYIENTILNLHEKDVFPRIGILTLDSSNIKHQKALIKRVSQSDIVKMHEEKLELIIGTSREFQGDERDIIIMTITTTSAVIDEDGNVSHRVLPKISGEEFMRIYNVAASRALYKSVLLHSVQLDTVSMIPPDCWRKKLIDYYHNIKPVYVINRDKIESVLEKTDSNLGRFGTEICTMLCEHGFKYCLFPSYRLGKYKIDFALLHKDSTLAIQCDGYDSEINPGENSGCVTDKELHDKLDQQMVLERVGWKVYRVQRADWFFNRQECMLKLLKWVARYIPPQYEG